VAYPPKTLEEVEKAAAAITNKAEGIYGWCARGKGAAGTSQFASVMYAFGSGWVTPDGKANLLDPKWLDAMNWYGNMIKNYGPPGATAMHWQQCQDLVLQGKIGMWLDASVFFANLLDPATSTIASTAGIAVAPEGPAGQNPHVAGWHISIYSQSKHKEAAWLFLQWALGKEMTLKAQLANITTARTSAWESLEFKKIGNQELIEAFTYAMQHGNPGWNPPVLSVGEARDAIGVVIIIAIEGGDIQAEAAKANTKLQELLDATPKLK
jgi:multiple sugar transport system substrate-binding protein